MAVFALVLYLGGVVLAFVLRSVVQRRRTGDTGLRLAAGPVGSVSWWAKVLFLIALTLGLGGPLAALAGVAPVAALDHPVVGVVGAVVATAGIVATLLAQTTMGASWRIGVDPGERTALVTTGTFALVRNPIFTAMIATSIGLTLMVPNVVSIIATVVLVASIQLQVRAVEEPYLARTHGPTYADYAARVGRFVPGVGVQGPRQTTRLP